MRSAYLTQPSLRLAKLPNRPADRLRHISLVLDGLRQLPQQILGDLVPSGVRADRGRDGLSAEQVLRIFVLYLLLKCTFEELEFYLADVTSLLRLLPPGNGRPGPQARHAAGQSEPAAPRDLAGPASPGVEQAVHRGVESGTTVRIDTTPVAAPLRAPTDSALLGDAVWVLERLLRSAQPLCPMSLPTRGRRVRRRTTALCSQKLDGNRSRVRLTSVPDGPYS